MHHSNNILKSQDSKVFSSLKTFFRDGRHFQIVFLGSFLIYGCFSLKWALEYERIIAIFFFAVLTQSVGIIAYRIPWHSIKSAIITALGLCLLFKTNSITIAALASIAAVGSKFLFRLNGKHLFNPANFGIIVILIFGGEGWVSPGQWGHESVMVFFFVVAAISVLFKVGRIDTSLAFILVFGGLVYIRSVLFLDWELDVFLHKMSNGSLLLFAFFMITDPKTTPNAKIARWIWAGIIGLMTFILTGWFYAHTAPLWVLFVAAPLTVVLDKYFKAEKFEWLNEKLQYETK